MRKNRERFFAPRGVLVRNRFGRIQPIVARVPITLCVPSPKVRLPGRASL